uniref:Claudin 34 n=1 Tax=Anolis carolinensis TaxID=28377 RepID=A0A803T569_ANOCA
MQIFLSMEKWLKRKLGLADGNFPDAAQLIHLAYIRLIGFTFAAIGWILCVTAIEAEEWRVWHLKPGTSTEKIWIGIWGVCFMEHTPDGDSRKQCLEFLDEHLSLPMEIFLAQDLMSLVFIVASLALSFLSFALWKLFHKGKPKNVLINFFCIGGVLNFLTSFIILIPLLWNMYSVLVNDSINFPDYFQLPVLPYEQNVGFAIYVGISASGFQLTSSILILSEKCWFRSRRAPTIIMVMPKQPTSADTEPCPRCGSAISLEKYRSEEQLFNL